MDRKREGVLNRERGGVRYEAREEQGWEEGGGGVWEKRNREMETGQSENEREGLRAEQASVFLRPPLSHAGPH